LDDVIQNKICGESLEPVLDMQKRHRCGEIAVAKISGKTFVKGMTMKDYVKGVLRSLRDGENKAITFQSIILKLAPSLAPQLYDNDDTEGLQSTFINSTIDLYCSLDGSEEDVRRMREFRTDLGELPPNELRMKECDDSFTNAKRAYYVDSSPVRNVAGSIIESIFTGPSLKRRSGWYNTKYYPVTDRNMLNTSVSVPRDWTVQSVNGDIASFTGSDVNGTMYALWAYTYLHSGVNGCDSPILLMMCGHPVEVRLSDVFFIYLYYTIGAVAVLPSGGSHIAMGGYLGIKGNMALSMQSLGTRVDYLNMIISFTDLVISVNPQLGGDDFHFLIWALSQSDTITYAQLLRMYMSRYVGMLKGFDVTFIDLSHSSESRLVSKFCKKNVDVRVSTEAHNQIVTVALESVRSLPILSNLIVPITIPPRLLGSAFRSFYKSMRSYFSRFDDMDHWVSVYCNAFLVTYGMCDGGVSITYDRIIRHDLTHGTDPMMTERVLIRLLRGPPIIMESGDVVVMSRRTYLQSLVSRGVIAMTRLKSEYGDKVDIFHEVHERQFIRKRKNVWRYTFYEEPDVKMLLSIYNKLRTYYE